MPAAHRLPHAPYADGPPGASSELAAGKRNAPRAPRWPPGRGRLPAVLGLALALGAGPAGQDTGIQGEVRDTHGTLLVGVLVQVDGADGHPYGTAGHTDGSGRFRIGPLEPGSYLVTFSHLGHRGTVHSAQVDPGGWTRLDAVLAPGVVELVGVEVDALRARSRLRFEDAGGLTVRELDREELKRIPGLAEADPLRAAATLPGVVTTSDLSAAFHVRGGSADQNLILLDGIPVFNPFHLGGAFSVFNTDMVERAELHSGGFPAEYGGRVASVLRVESDVGDGSFGVDAGISLLAARVAARGAIPDRFADQLGLERARWRVSARRSYFDQLLRPVFEFPYHMTDVQGRFEGWTRGGDRVTMSAYAGGDVLDLGALDAEVFPLRANWGWGNRLVGAGWTRPRPGGGRLEGRAGMSQFDTQLRFRDFDDTEIRSEIGQVFLALDLAERLAPSWTLGVGAEVSRLRHDNLFSTGGSDLSGTADHAWLGSTYGQLAWRSDFRWHIEGGLRLDGIRAGSGMSTIQASPRASVRRGFAEGAGAVRLSTGRYTQALHSVRDEALPLGLDVWMVAGRDVPFVVSDQAQIGVEGYPLRGWFLSLEGYARDFDGVVANNLANDPNDPSDALLEGDGLSYGADLLVRREDGDTRGWIALSWLRASRTFPETASGLEPGAEITFAPVFDRRLDANLVVQRSIGWGLDGGLRWHAGTGTPYTRPVASYAMYTTRLSADGRRRWQGSAEPESSGGYAVVLGPRNAERYPLYHRLDVSLRRPMTRSWGSLVPYLDILNVYNRRNVLFYFYQFDRDPPVRSGISMFPLLPMVGFEVQF